jgi:hypothetical protein
VSHLEELRKAMKNFSSDCVLAKIRTGHHPIEFGSITAKKPTYSVSTGKEDISSPYRELNAARIDGGQD